MVGLGHMSLGRNVATVFDGRIWSIRFEEMLLLCLMVGFAHIRLEESLLSCLMVGFGNISLGRQFATVFDARILSHFAWKIFCYLV